jgi:hypothetical protein
MVAAAAYDCVAPAVVQTSAKLLAFPEVDELEAGLEADDAKWAKWAKIIIQAVE